MFGQLRSFHIIFHAWWFIAGSLFLQKQFSNVIEHHMEFFLEILI